MDHSDAEWAGDSVTGYHRLEPPMPIFAPTRIHQIMLLVVFVLLAARATADGQTPPAPATAATATNAPLRVGTHQAAPFAYKAEGEWKGIAIDLWNDIADEMGREFVLEELPLEEMFKRIEAGTLDVGIGAISITVERDERFDFTHTFYGSGLGIATRHDETGRWRGILDRLRSAAFLEALGALFLALGIAATFVYFFERRHNAEEFGGSLSEGIGASLWWSAVTMTTVGYGDKAPKTVGGRVVGFLWMFTSVVIVSTFTASIASSLTVTQLADRVRGPKDLVNVRVVTVTGSSSASYLRGQGIRYEQRANAEEALQMLTDSRADAVVFDRPVLQYHIGKDSNSKLMVLASTLMRENYGFALTPNSLLREPMNRALLRATQSESYKRNLSQYLGASD